MKEDNISRSNLSLSVKLSIFHDVIYLLKSHGICAQII
jgi:hypothetical protein